jgi:hypothetical protein
MEENKDAQPARFTMRRVGARGLGLIVHMKRNGLVRGRGHVTHAGEQSIANLCERSSALLCPTRLALRMPMPMPCYSRVEAADWS